MFLFNLLRVLRCVDLSFRKFYFKFPQQIILLELKKMLRWANGYGTRIRYEGGFMWVTRPRVFSLSVKLKYPLPLVSIYCDGAVSLCICAIAERNCR